MIGRTTGGTSYTLTYDAENHLISAATASFVYDGDGLRVESTFGSGDSAGIASFSGKHFEVNSVYRESFDDLAAQNWQVNSGTWQLQDGGYRQSNTTHTNTFTYYNLLQNQPQVVQWKATYTSGTQAGLYFYASSAAASDAERGNSYRVWQDGTTVKIYESANNIPTQRASFAAANATGQTHSYQAMYNPQNGKIQVWRDGSDLGSWTDSTPLTTGNYLSLRTTSSNVLFDEVMVGKVKKYYYQAGARVAMRDGTSVYYLFGDHLGSTNVTTDNGSALVARLLFKPFGQVRYNTNNQKTDYRFTGQWWASGGGATLGLYDYGARWYDPSLARFIQADTIVPQPGNPQSLNRYTYAANSPLVYNDPDGHCAPLCTGIAGAVVGGIIGAGSIALPQMIENVREGQPLMANIDPGEVGKAAVTGAIAGGVAGATFGVGTAALGAGFGGTVISGAIAGAAGRQASVVTGNALAGRDLAENVGNVGEVAQAAAFGGATAGVGYGVGKGAQALVTRRMQSLTNSANQRLTADPSIAKSVLSPKEFAAGQRSSRITPMQYGNAVERLTAKSIEGSRLDNSLFEHISAPGRMGPDLVGRGVFQNMQFDITTPGQVGTHLTRPYYYNRTCELEKNEVE